MVFAKCVTSLHTVHQAEHLGLCCSPMEITFKGGKNEDFEKEVSGQVFGEHVGMDKEW